MNHCHDCNSSYVNPGTCNCFAPGGKRAQTETPDISPEVRDAIRKLKEGGVVTIPATPRVKPWAPSTGSTGTYRCTSCGQMVGTFEVHSCSMPMWRSDGSAAVVRYEGTYTRTYLSNGCPLRRVAT